MLECNRFYLLGGKGVRRGEGQRNVVADGGAGIEKIYSGFGKLERKSWGFFMNPVARDRRGYVLSKSLG